MKRKGDDPGDNAEKRKRQFEDSRGLSERPELPLDEDVEGEPAAPANGDKEKENDRGGKAE